MEEIRFDPFGNAQGSVVVDLARYRKRVKHPSKMTKQELLQHMHKDHPELPANSNVGTETLQAMHADVHGSMGRLQNGHEHDTEDGNKARRQDFSRSGRTTDEGEMFTSRPDLIELATPVEDTAVSLHDIPTTPEDVYNDNQLHDLSLPELQHHYRHAVKTFGAMHHYSRRVARHLNRREDLRKKDMFGDDMYPQAPKLVRKPV